MLVKCPECEGVVSDRAFNCPHCGFPINKPPNERRRNIAKRMRLPNGFGRITEIKGRNLRKPFRAMVSFGRDEKGRPIGKLLKPQAYFSTYNDAYQALMQYHSHPYEFDNDSTVEDIYNSWFEQKIKTISKYRIKNLKSTWKYFTSIKDIKFQNIKIKDIKLFLSECYRIDDKGKKVYPTPRIKYEVQHLFNELFKHAIECEIITHNYMDDISSKERMPSAASHHSSFSKEEMDILREHIGESQALDMMLFQCYSGMRPDEMCNIKIVNVHLDKWYVVGGNKTAAGINREIPIHKRIRPILEREMKRSIDSGCEYLFSVNGSKVNYERYYREYFHGVIEQYKMDPNHKPHDCRKQFVTMAKEAEMDEYAIKRIVGHNIKDVTESVYTDRSIEWLHKELSKMY